MAGFSKTVLLTLLQGMSTIDLALAHYCSWGRCSVTEYCCEDETCCDLGSNGTFYIVFGVSIGLFLLFTCCGCLLCHQYPQWRTLIYRIPNGNYVQISDEPNILSVNSEQIYNPRPLYGGPVERPKHPNNPPPYSESA